MAKKVGFINGCFDVLHFGHLKMLEYAKNQVDFLIVAIDSDDRVKEQKGKFRPFNNQEVRKYFLTCINFVDKVEIFSSKQDLENLIKDINPDIMIVGAEYQDKEVVGSQYAKSLEFFKKIDGYSTTKILQHVGIR